MSEGEKPKPKLPDHVDSPAANTVLGEFGDIPNEEQWVDVMSENPGGYRSRVDPADQPEASPPTREKPEVAIVSPSRDENRQSRSSGFHHSIGNAWRKFFPNREIPISAAPIVEKMVAENRVDKAGSEALKDAITRAQTSNADRSAETPEDQKKD